MTTCLNDLFDDTPDLNVYREAIHSLSDLGGIIAPATGIAHPNQGFQRDREKSEFSRSTTICSARTNLRRRRTSLPRSRNSNELRRLRRSWNTQRAKSTNTSWRS